MTPDEAFAVYVSMDGSRSLPKLRAQLAAEGLKVPEMMVAALECPLFA